MLDLYFLSVVTPRDLQLFKLNVESTVKLNEGQRLTWIVVCNGWNFEFDNLRGDLEKIKSGCVNFVLHPLNLSILAKHKLHKQSFEHGYAINHGIKESKLSHGQLVVIDPDFIFIKPNWIRILILGSESMQTNVIGTSWDPARLKDWGDFPAPHFMSLKCETAANADFTPKNKRGTLLKSNGTVFNFLKWINQRIETGSKLQTRKQIASAAFLKFQLMIFFNFHRLLPNSKVCNMDYLYKKVKSIQTNGGIVLEHSHSYRSKKALKNLKEVNFWYLQPEITFRYLVFLRNKAKFNNIPHEFFSSPLEFLNLEDEIVAVHARSVGSKYVSENDFRNFLKKCNP